MVKKQQLPSMAVLILGGYLVEVYTFVKNSRRCLFFVFLTWFINFLSIRKNGPCLKSRTSPKNLLPKKNRQPCRAFFSRHVYSCKPIEAKKLRAKSPKKKILQKNKLRMSSSYDMLNLHLITCSKTSFLFIRAQKQNCPSQT